MHLSGAISLFKTSPLISKLHLMQPKISELIALGLSLLQNVQLTPFS